MAATFALPCPPLPEPYRKRGRNRNFCPPLPGVTPATTLVPYSMHWVVWKLPALPDPLNHEARILVN